ncbi:FAD-dependent oxidoreductase [Cyanobacterium sp. IPPAS B-1200]|uniref:FAD-dependent oxidoreductase n=1 Tax=Cyanobacterium sp. IPPAS B-1200 TaxID=1562720 RepID=UPI0008528A6C|nr:FAD-dependent oxidoreductase [Cyanobacterium sp. IPPAS B-1200]OEJ79199.1 hypothetical protein A5482_10635 [Cyanobacterium sp. IPPAS B-1200]
MKLTYDLIILGGSLEAIWGAKYAANFGARVALIIDVNFGAEEGKKYLFQQLQTELLSPNSFHNREDILEEKKRLIEDVLLPELDSLEVDVIFSDFQFTLEGNKTAIKTKNDILMANGYIITTPLYNYQHPDWVGIEDINYLTGYDVFTSWDIDSLPNNLVVIGDDEMAINISSLLIRHQKKVTLLTTQGHILPWEDADIAFLIQCQLESMGINVLTNYQVTQVKSIDNSKWIQAGDKAIEYEQIIISDGFLKRQVSFNFDGLEEQKQSIFNFNETNLLVNKKLQTYHSLIYCVGGLLGGYNHLNIAKEEIRVAINNILFLNFNKINYDEIPYDINIISGVSRIGYSESQVKSLYGDSWDSFVIKDTFLSPFDLEQKHFYIKLIVSKTNEILGCHCWGYKRELLMNIIGVMIKTNNNIKYLFTIAISDDFVRSIINELEIMFAKKKYSRKFSLLESWFIWRRK